MKHYLLQKFDLKNFIKINQSKIHYNGIENELKIDQKWKEEDFLYDLNRCS